MTTPTAAYDREAQTTPTTRNDSSTKSAGPAISRAWAFSGIGAAVAAIVGIGASMGIDAVYNETVAGDPTAIVDRLADQTVPIIVFHVATMISALLLLVFAAGLKRRLDAQAPAGSLLPTVASWGLVLVSVAGLLGTGLDTEFVFGVNDPDVMVPEVGVFFGHWVGTIPWLWVGAGVAALALAIAALKHAAAPKWIGIVSLILGVITVLFGISPLQYMAGMFGPIWLLVTSLGFAFGDRMNR